MNVFDEVLIRFEDKERKKLLTLALQNYSLAKTISYAAKLPTISYRSYFMPAFKVSVYVIS